MAVAAPPYPSPWEARFKYIEEQGKVYAERAEMDNPRMSTYNPFEGFKDLLRILDESHHHDGHQYDTGRFIHVLDLLAEAQHTLYQAWRLANPSG